jgi:hypothetical protein
MDKVQSKENSNNIIPSPKTFREELFFQYKIHHFLTPSSRVLLEELTIFQRERNTTPHVEPEGSLPRSTS